MGIRQTLVLVLLFVLTGVVLASGSDNALDHLFIYFPQRTLEATPAEFGLAYEEVGFAAADHTRLHGWYIPGQPERPLLLFFHGNAGNISHRLYNLRQLHGLGLNLFIFDYRGYGQSTGKASEAGTYSDARGALAWLTGRGWTPGRMVYFGRSLGAAVAVQLALEEPPAGLILETPFTSIAAMGRHHYPLLSLLLGSLIEARYDNLAKIEQVRSPLLILQGDRDRIVPPAMARELFERANQPKTWYLIPGAGHNDTYTVADEEYWSAWSAFLSRLSPAL